MEYVSLTTLTPIYLSGDHPVLARAADYLIHRVRAGAGLTLAVGDADAPDGPRIQLRLEPQEGPERYRITATNDPNGSVIDIWSSSPSVVLGAVGQLVRSLVIEPGRARAQVGTSEVSPAYPVRGHVLANHKQNNTYDLWTYEQWEACLTELAAWGNNLLIVYPAHPSRWHGALPFDDEPWFDTPERAREWERQYAIQLRLPDLCHELGLRYGAYISPNDIWPEQVVRDPELSRHSSSFVCARRPPARAAINALRRRVFADLPGLDVLFVPSKDDGGCPGCPDCSPWVQTYLELVEEQAELVREYHPECTLWLSQQGLPWAETVAVTDWLAAAEPDYVEAVAYGPFSEIMLLGGPENESRLPATEDHRRGPATLRALVPDRYGMVLYPDIVHPWRAQYPVRDMDPVVQYVWGREDAPVPRIRATIEQFAQTAPTSIGMTPYSEGDTDDVNKYAWSRLQWDPSLSARDIAQAYATEHFGAGHAATVGSVLLEIETALQEPLGTEAAGRVQLAWRAAVERAGTWADSGDWRWDSIRYCVELIVHLDAVHRRDRELAATLRFRVAAWYDDVDLGPGLTSTREFLRGALARSAEQIDGLRNLRAGLFGTHAIRLRSAVRIQASYHGFDVLLTQLDEIARDLDEGTAGDWPTTRAQIWGAVQAAEATHVVAARGVQVVDDLVEFPWETGPTRWHSR